MPRVCTLVLFIIIGESLSEPQGNDFAVGIYIYNYVTVHAKTLRKSGKIFDEIEADFASPVFNLPLLQISYG